MREQIRHARVLPLDLKYSRTVVDHELFTLDLTSRRHRKLKEEGFKKKSFILSVLHIAGRPWHEILLNLPTTLSAEVLGGRGGAGRGRINNKRGFKKKNQYGLSGKWCPLIHIQAYF